MNFSADVVCVFGYKPEEILLEAGSWIENQNKYLIFCSEDPWVDFSLYPNVRVLLMSENGFPWDLFEEICKELVFLQFDYRVHPQKESSYMVRLKALCEACQSHIHLLASDVQDFGLGVFQNVSRNIYSGLEMRDFRSLKGALVGVPAVVCGAGPGLSDVAEDLRGIQDRVCVFSGGSGLLALSRLGVDVHLAAGVDPDPCYHPLLHHHHGEVPFFYQNRVSHRILSSMHGEKILVPSEIRTPFEKWCQPEFDQSLDGGWTVATFCTALASYLGCNPICFVGMDFGYPPDKGMYAEESLKKEEVEEISLQDPEVGLLFTKKDWLMAARWIEQHRLEHMDLSFYQTSMRGMSLEGVCRKPLWQISSERNWPQIDIRGRIRQMLSHASTIYVDLKKYALALEEINQSLQRVDLLCRELLNAFEKSYPEDPTERGSFVLGLYDLYDEVAYQKILDPLWQIWQWPISRPLHNSYERALHRLIFLRKLTREYGRKCFLWQ